MSLDDYRIGIDEADLAIAKAFAGRMDFVRQIAEYKIKNNLPILNPGREKEVLARTAELLPQKLRPYGERLFYSIMSLSKEYQNEFFPKQALPEPNGAVGFQGTEGSFSHEALESYFGIHTKALPYRLFEDLAKAVSQGEVSYGVLPIENSSTGAINEVYDLLHKYSLVIAGEKIIPIRHNLLAVKGATLQSVKTVYSHVQGLQQSSSFLKAHLQYNPVEATNTAAAARMVAETNDPSLAAIASQRAGEIYGLEVLVPNIHNSSGNSTRFIIVSRIAENIPADKISIAFTLSHKPGALCSVLRVLEEYKLNICKIESRPMPERPWEYVFYLDFDASSASLETQNALKKLKKICSSFSLLGAYRGDRGLP